MMPPFFLFAMLLVRIFFIILKIVQVFQGGKKNPGHNYFAHDAFGQDSFCNFGNC